MVFVGILASRPPKFGSLFYLDLTSLSTGLKAEWGRTGYSPAIG